MTVVLGSQGSTFRGRAESPGPGPDAPGPLDGDRHRSVVSATLRALEVMVDGAARFDAEQVEVARLGAERTAFVLVKMTAGSTTRRLTGTSVIGEDEEQALVRAVLAAVNRSLGVLPPRARPAEDS